MLFKSVFLAALLSASVAVAAPATNLPQDGVYRWKVWNWIARCDGNGCNYKFEIEGDKFGKDPERPAFRGNCNGTHDGGPTPMAFAPCKIEIFDPSIGAAVASQTLQSKFLPFTAGGTKTNTNTLNLQVAYTFSLNDKEGSTWTYTNKGAPGPVFAEATIFNIDGIDGVKSTKKTR